MNRSGNNIYHYYYGNTNSSYPPVPHDPFVAQESIRQFLHEQHINATWFAPHTLLKNQMFSNVYNPYIFPLKLWLTKYTIATANDLLKHLWNTYRKVDIADLASNKGRMKAQ